MFVANIVCVKKRLDGCVCVCLFESDKEREFGCVLERDRDCICVS